MECWEPHRGDFLEIFYLAFLLKFDHSVGICLKYDKKYEPYMETYVYLCCYAGLPNWGTPYCVRASSGGRGTFRYLKVMFGRRRLQTPLFTRYIQDLWYPASYNVAVMIDCRSVDKVRGKKLMFCANCSVALQTPACLVAFLKVFTHVVCRDPNVANEPELIRCVDILCIVSHFVLYTVLDLSISSFE
jgi:hypothetical protein